MRFRAYVVENSSRELRFNLTVDTDELPSGATRYTARLSSGQYRKLYAHITNGLELRIMPSWDTNWHKARLFNDTIIWEM